MTEQEQDGCSMEVSKRKFAGRVLSGPNSSLFMESYEPHMTIAGFGPDRDGEVHYVHYDLPNIGGVWVERHTHLATTIYNLAAQIRNRNDEVEKARIDSKTLLEQADLLNDIRKTLIATGHDHSPPLDRAVDAAIDIERVRHDESLETIAAALGVRFVHGASYQSRARSIADMITAMRKGVDRERAEVAALKKQVDALEERKTMERVMAAETGQAGRPWGGGGGGGLSGGGGGGLGAGGPVTMMVSTKLPLEARVDNLESDARRTRDRVRELESRSHDALTRVEALENR